MERAESVFQIPGFAMVKLTALINPMKRTVPLTALTTPAVPENFSVETVERASQRCSFATATTIAQTNQMKKTAQALVVQTTLSAMTKGSVFPCAGSVMVIETALTIQTKQTALKWCRHVTGENSSVKMVRVFMSAGVVMEIETAATIQTS